MNNIEKYYNKTIKAIPISRVIGDDFDGCEGCMFKLNRFECSVPKKVFDSFIRKCGIHNVIYKPISIIELLEKL